MFPTDSERQININTVDAVALAIGIVQLNGICWSAKISDVQIYVDNFTVVRAMFSETTKCLTMVPVMEYIFEYFDIHKICFRCELIPSKENTVADALSREDGFPFNDFRNRNIFRIYPSLESLEVFILENELYLFDSRFLSMFPSSQVFGCCDSVSILDFDFRDHINTVNVENVDDVSAINQPDSNNNRRSNNRRNSQNNPNGRVQTYRDNYYHESQSSNSGQ